MDFEVVFSQRALAELEKILAFISVDNPEAGRRFYARLRQTALSLRRFPKRHPDVAGRPNRRKLSVQAYTLYYRIDEAKRQVTILHFWHGARQPPP